MKPRMHTPAVYTILVVGELDEKWSGRLGGMTISKSQVADHQWVTKLTGRLADQAALYGVLSTLYDMHFPLLSAECSDCD